MLYMNLLIGKIESVLTVNSQKILKAYKNFYQYIAIGNAMLSKSAAQDNALGKAVATSFYATYYFFFKKQRLAVNDMMIANPDLKLALELWNMLENKFIMQAFELGLPSIKINRKIFIPMVDTIITRENIKELPKLNYKAHTGWSVLNNKLRKERLNLEGDLSFEDVKAEIDFGIKHDSYNPK